MSKSALKTIATAAIKLLDDGASESDLSQNLAAYLVAERRTSELGPLIRLITEMRAQTGIHEATLSSAFPVDAATQKVISDLIASRQAVSKSVLIKSVHDPSVLGGIKVETHDLLLDTTMSGKLKHLHQLTSKS